MTSPQRSPSSRGGSHRGDDPRDSSPPVGRDPDRATQQAGGVAHPPSPDPEGATEPAGPTQPTVGAPSTQLSATGEPGVTAVSYDTPKSKRPKSLLNSEDSVGRRRRDIEAGRDTAHPRAASGHQLYRRDTIPINRPADTIEPDLKSIRTTAHSGTLQRDIIAFAIIARGLIMNEPDGTIISLLAAANRPIHKGILEEIKKRSDFQEYYRQYRENLMRDTDMKMKDIFTKERVTAALRVVNIMKAGRRYDPKSGGYVDDESLQLKAAIEVLDRGGSPAPASAAPTVPVTVGVQIALLDKARAHVRTVEATRSDD